MGACRKSWAPIPTFGTRAAEASTRSVEDMDGLQNEQGTPAIVAEHLCKRYGNTVAVHDVSVTVGIGETVGIVGVNGAGKTTTVETIAGLRAPDGGRVRVLGLDPLRDRTALRQVLGVQLQRATLHTR